VARSVILTLGHLATDVLFPTPPTPNSNLGTAHGGWPSTITAHRLAFGLNKSLILLKPTSIIDSRPHYTAPSCPTALYPTQPTILTLWTWVQYVGWPSAERESYSIETHPYP
jgi:hypothetical protein